MAIVNKPAGIVVYRAEGGRGGGARAGGHGRDTLLSALSFVLTPSNFTHGVDDDDQNVPLKRPHPVHRLDRPTSGLMVVAKTKAAAVHLAQQFEYRKARKTYMAIVNGSPISHENGESYTEWNTIDHDLDGKSAITKWRQIQKVDSLRGKNGQLTLVELKPKTGV
jgi:tRNA pseudouridine65 synthase/23S rRNA pseudouridine1911/1915/1917 synthase